MNRKRAFRRRRRGGVYLIVLGVALIVSVMSFSALLLQRMQRRLAQDSADAAQARLYAQAALKMGMLRIENDPDWRYNLPNGVWESDVAIGDGAYSIEGIDPSDGDLTDAPEEPVVLTGTGRQGAAVQRMRITLAPAHRGFDSLETALLAGDTLSVQSATIDCDQTVAANNQAIASGAAVNCDVEAVNAIAGSAYNGSQTAGVDARQLPDPTAVFDYYKANGAWIDINDIVSPVPVPPPSNLLTNPGFEDGLAPWAPWQGDSCVLNLDGKEHAGAYSVRVRDRVNFQAGPVQDISSFVQSGATYFCGGWVYMTAEDSHAHFVIDVTSSGEGAQWWLSSDTYCRQDEWTYVSGTITPTFSGSVSSATLKLETKNGDYVSDFYLDEAVLMVNPQQPPGPNLLAKGDMEGDPLTDWYAVGCGIATSTIEHAGEQAIKAKNRDNLADTFAQDVTDAVQNGAAYFAEGWVRQNVTWSHFQLMLKLVSTGDGTRSIPLSPPVYAPAYTYVRAYGETLVSWTGDLVSAEFYVANLNNADNAMRLDDAVLIMAQPPPLPPHTIYRQVISPGHNPYGAGQTNPDGVYVIDCQGEEIHVDRSRILGTLVLLNVGAGSSIRQGPVNWSPARSNYPALMIQGDLEIRADDMGLNEYYEQTNFNPPGAPDEAMGEDADASDIYPSEINGLVYATGSLTLANHPTIRGVVLAGGDATATGPNLELSYRPTFLQNPPPGFNGPEEIRVLLGSVRKVVQ